MKGMGLVLGILLAGSLVTGCAIVKVYTSDPAVQIADSADYHIEVEAQQQAGKHYFDDFRLIVINKTDSEMKIDWSQSYYLLNGRKHGKLGWKGMSADQLKEVKKAPLVPIKGGNTFSQIIFPLKLIGWEGLRSKSAQTDPRLKSGFYPGILPAGKNGIELALILNGKTVLERLTITIVMKELKQ